VDAALLAAYSDIEWKWGTHGRYRQVREFLITAPWFHRHINGGARGGARNGIRHEPDACRSSMPVHGEMQGQQIRSEYCATLLTSCSRASMRSCFAVSLGPSPPAPPLAPSPPAAPVDGSLPGADDISA
jgi:hypothetical protein